MKLLRVGDKDREKVAAIDKNGAIRDISSVIDDLDPKTINFSTLEKLNKINLDKFSKLDPDIRIGSCLSRPGNFFAIGLNYKEHAKETNVVPPTKPILFNKSVHCLVGANDNVILPKFSKKLDHEIEIAFVIGKKTKNVSEENAQDHIFGYCICNDVSERDWQKSEGGQWVKGKSGDTFGPIGPYLVTKDEIPNINDLNLTLEVNDERRQTGNTKEMIFNFNFLVSHISKFITLMPGDIVTTGTPPGVGMGMSPPTFLKEGDIMSLKADHLGEQRTKIVKK